MTPAELVVEETSKRKKRNLHQSVIGCLRAKPFNVHVRQEMQDIVQVVIAIETLPNVNIYYITGGLLSLFHAIPI